MSKFFSLHSSSEIKFKAVLGVMTKIMTVCCFKTLKHELYVNNVKKIQLLPLRKQPVFVTKTGYLWRAKFLYVNVTLTHKKYIYVVANRFIIPYLLCFIL